MVNRILKRRQILSEREAELRAEEQALLERLHTALDRFGADVTAADAQRLREATAQLAELFLIVIAGEFNAGKSSFINALIGERVLPEGVTPTTDRINILRYGEEISDRLIEDFLLERTYPSPVLGELNIVDTPGTNAIIRRHEELTRDYVPRSDLVLFVTSADRPFTESERTFLEQIREWGKKIILVINKIDILEPAEAEQVVAFVRANATTLLGVEPEVFPVSARNAQRARQGDDPAAWEASGFAAVETYLLRTLDQQERVRLKLLNPLGVGLRLSQTYRAAADERLKTLAGDLSAIENIEGQLSAYRAEMQRDFEPRLGRLEMLLQELEERANRFFDEHVRVGRIKGLLKPDVMQQEFRQEVVGDMDARIDAEVQHIIDWLIERNLKLWQDVNSYLDRRQLTRHREEMIGDVGQNFSYNRQALLNSVGRTAQQVVSTYNRDAEAAGLAADVRGTLATTAIAEVGAVGIGTLAVIVLHGALLDFTGILLGVSLAAGGFYIIPAKRRQLKRDFHQKISELRNTLVRSLTRQVNDEIDAAMERIRETIAPYTRFVKFQHEQLGVARGELTAVEGALGRLRNEITGE
ncbi:MAG TPA: dynamin family protein [Herpetosiphonaceae bacterium]